MIDQKKVEAESIKYFGDESIDPSTAFEDGVKFAEKEFKELAMWFLAWCCARKLDITHYGDIVVPDHDTIFEEFLKERNND